MMKMKIQIIEEHSAKTLIREYYNIPQKVANAVQTLLDECANRESEIYSAESETETNSHTVHKGVFELVKEYIR